MRHEIKGIVFDIDGVLEFQGTVYPRAIETVEALRREGALLRFLTNSTLKSRAACAAMLRQHGFAISDEEVFTASYLTAQYLRQIAPRSCWVMVDREGADEFKEFPKDAKHPEYVVIGDARSQFDFEHLNRALRWLLAGSRLIGMQAELLDASMGAAELNVGSWIGMLEKASGVQAVYIGKPGSFAFESVLASMRLPAEEVAVIGDRIQTDIVGAQRLGMFTVLVRSGEFREQDLALGARPDATIAQIGELLGVLPGRHHAAKDAAA
jgi:HAD superfamily hydrolase (TIGR01458 family)